MGPVSMSPIHGCNDTDADLESATEIVTEQNETQPTYNYFTEEPKGTEEAIVETEEAIVETEATTVKSKSFEDIQPKALNFAGLDNKIQSVEKNLVNKGEKPNSEILKEKFAEEENETTESSLITEVEIEKESELNEPSVETTVGLKDVTTPITTPQPMTSSVLTTLKPEPVTTRTSTQSTIKITTTLTPTTTETLTTTMKPTTKLSTTKSTERIMTTDTPFIVYPEESEISNEIPMADELSKPEKNSIISTTASYSIVRPVATYHIVPAKKDKGNVSRKILNLFQ